MEDTPSAYNGDRFQISYKQGNDGEEKTVEITSKEQTIDKLINGKEYTVKVRVQKQNGSEWISGLSNNVGTNTWKLTLKGDYQGSVSGKYTINPKGTSLGRMKAAKKALTVKWTKQTGAMSKSRISGYQVRYSMKSNMKGAKTKTYAGYKTASKKIGGLKSKKRYYVQVRTYMKVGGKPYYSGWSAKKSAKIK